MFVATEPPQKPSKLQQERHVWRPMSGECDSSGVCEGNAEGRMKNAEMLGAGADLTAYAWRSCLCG
jgi:hypothetical protein